MHNTDGSTNGDLAPKPMKGKYDMRKNNGATKERRRTNSNLGRKPTWLKHLDRNSAYNVLRELQDKARWPEIYAAAWGKGNHALCFEILRYLTDRRDGRPFIAENPAKADSANGLAKDERLQAAIKSLVQTPAVKNVM